MSEIVEWKQTNLEEWYIENVTTLEDAIAVGKALLETGEKVQIALGLLLNHVDEYDLSARKLADRLGLPWKTANGYIAATKTPELVDRSTTLGTSKVEIIERAENPEIIWEWVDSHDEEHIPTKREIVQEIKKQVQDYHDCIWLEITDESQTMCKSLVRYKSMTSSDRFYCNQSHSCKFFEDTELLRALSPREEITPTHDDMLYSSPLEDEIQREPVDSTESTMDDLMTTLRTAYSIAEELGVLDIMESLDDIITHLKEMPEREIVKVEGSA